MRVGGPARGSGDRERIKRHENLNKRHLGVIANFLAWDSISKFILIRASSASDFKIGSAAIGAAVTC